MYTLQIKIQTYNYKHFYELKKTLKVLSKSNKNINKIKKSFINLPKNKKKIFTVLRSPHVHKKSRESFRYTKYKMVLKLIDKNLLILLYLNYFLKNIISKDFLFNTKIILNEKCL